MLWFPGALWVGGSFWKELGRGDKGPHLLRTQGVGYMAGLNSQDPSGKLGLAAPGAGRENRGSERQADLPKPT